MQYYPDADQQALLVKQVARQRRVEADEPGLVKAVNLMIRNARSYISRMVRDTVYELLVPADDLRARRDAKHSKEPVKASRPKVCGEC